MLIFVKIEILTLCSKYCFSLIGMPKYKQNCWIHTVFSTPNKLSYGSKSISTVVNLILEKIQNFQFCEIFSKIMQCMAFVKSFPIKIPIWGHCDQEKESKILLSRARKQCM